MMRASLYRGAVYTLATSRPIQDEHNVQQGPREGPVPHDSSDHLVHLHLDEQPIQDEHNVRRLPREDHVPHDSAHHLVPLGLNEQPLQSEHGER